MTIKFKNIITVVFIVIILLIMIAMPDEENDAFASTPFARKEIKDEPSDWIDISNSIEMNRPVYAASGDSSADIEAVSYFSNGRVLNATLWLLLPLEKSRFDNKEVLNYGMLIDADSDNRTGWGGIDYKIEVRRENATWTRVLEEWSSTKEFRLLREEPNITESFKDQKRYFSLYADLEMMGSPDLYKIVFYAEEQRKGESTSRIDFTKWVHIPAPEFSISTVPNPLVLRAGESRTIELQVKSNTGFQPKVTLSIPDNQVDDTISMSFLSSNMSEGDRREELHIERFSPYGLVTTSMQTEVSEGIAAYRPYTFTVTATATFPPESFIHPLIVGIDSSFESLAFLGTESESRTTQSSVTVDVQRPQSSFEKFTDFWDAINPFLSLILGVIGLVSGWKLGRRRERGKGGK
jgi:hypothetical protein